MNCKGEKTDQYSDWESKHCNYPDDVVVVYFLTLKPQKGDLAWGITVCSRMACCVGYKYMIQAKFVSGRRPHKFTQMFSTRKTPVM